MQKCSHPNKNILVMPTEKTFAALNLEGLPMIYIPAETMDDNRQTDPWIIKRNFTQNVGTRD